MKVEYLKKILANTCESGRSQKKWVVFSNGYAFEASPLFSKKTLHLLARNLRSGIVYYLKKIITSKNVRRCKVFIAQTSCEIEAVSGNHVNQNLILFTKDSIVKYYCNQNEFERLNEVFQVYEQLASTLEGVSLPEVRSIDKLEGTIKVDFERVRNLTPVTDVKEVMSLLSSLQPQLRKIPYSGKLSIEQFIEIYCSSNGLGLMKKGLLEACESLERSENFILQHGDFWLGNVLKSDGRYYLIDFDNVAFLPRYYDRVYFVFAQILTQFPTFLTKVLNGVEVLSGFRDRDAIVSYLYDSSISRSEVKLCERIYFSIKYMYNLSNNDNFSKKEVERFLSNLDCGSNDEPSVLELALGLEL